MNYLKLVIWALVLPCCLSAQVDLSLFPHYNAELMEDLGVTDVQLESIRNLNATISEQKTQLYNALLFRPDLEEATAKLDMQQQAEMHKIITADQKRAYQQFHEDIEAEQRITDLKRYKDMYLDVYHYLKLDGEQAQLLADLEVAVRDGEHKREDYTTLKKNLLQQILSEKQWKKYSKKRKKERIEATKKISGTMSYAAVEERMQVKMTQIEKIIPKRIALRHSLEQQMSQQDRQTIEYLRSLYDDKQAARKPSEQTYEGIVIVEEYEKLSREQVIDQYHIVDGVIHDERATFEKAKRLAIKFDKAIDALQGELWELKKLRYDGVEGLFMRQLATKRPSQAEMMTERVELNRNIAFLLIPMEEVSANTATKHQLTAYPLPARVMQSLSLEVQKAGSVRVELLDAQGKLIEVLLQEQLNAGTHKREFDISNLVSGIFFYRVESVDGTSLLKSLKVD